MKNYILLLLLSILIFKTTISFAQVRIDIGVKAGISIPNLTSGSSANPINSGYGSRLDADAAVHIEYYFSNHFSIQPQLEYSSQGGKKNGNQAFTVPTEMEQLFPPDQIPPYLYANYKSTAKMNYLMLPILVKYRFTIARHWGGYIAAGPFVSFLLSAKNVTNGTSEIYLDDQHSQPLPTGSQSFDNTENVRNDLHKFNAGINGHIGIDYKLARGNLFIEGGGNYGFVSIQKNETNGKNRTGAGIVVIGYQFRLGQ